MNFDSREKKILYPKLRVLQAVQPVLTCLTRLQVSLPVSLAVGLTDSLLTCQGAVQPP
jgi:hypothetical protein